MQAVSPEGLAALLRNRRMIYDFKPQAPPRETVLRGIDLARWAPNHYVTEPWHFYLLGPETAVAIAQLNAELVAAREGPEAGARKLERWRAMPGSLVVTCDNSNDPVRAREDYAACCCAVQNLMLYLWSEGVGVKWGTGKVTREPRFYDLIWVDPARETVVGMFWYGYPAEVPQGTRRPVESIVVNLP